MNKVFEFYQNNSGGSSIIDAKLSKLVYIEAEDASAANRIAKKLGIYFDGVIKGFDCECCGDRWSKVGDEDIINDTYKYGVILPHSGDTEYDYILQVIRSNIKEFRSEDKKYPVALLYLLNGKKIEFFYEEQR